MTAEIAFTLTEGEAEDLAVYGSGDRVAIERLRYGRLLVVFEREEQHYGFFYHEGVMRGQEYEAVPVPVYRVTGTPVTIVKWSVNRGR